MIPIDKGIPIPRPRRGGRGRRPPLYPWGGMEVGDSFLAEGLTQQHVTAVSRYAARKHGWKFTTRVVEGGVRIWRIA